MTVPDFKAGFTALNRFGFGARGDGDLAAAASDPRGFLKAELAQPGIALLGGPGMPRTALALQAMFADEDQKKAERARTAAEALAQPAMATETAMAANPNTTVSSPPPLQTANMGPPKPPSPEQLVYRAEALARFQRSRAHGKARRRFSISRATRRQQNILQRSSPAISPPTSRRWRSSRASPVSFPRPMAT
jgi:uncharacterized protein (DUF1800 family)